MKDKSSFPGVLVVILLLTTSSNALAQEDTTVLRQTPSAIPYYLQRPALESPRSRAVFDTLYNGRSRRNRVEQQLIDQGHDVAGKRPILPIKPDTQLRDPAGNVLPSRDPARNFSGPQLERPILDFSSPYHRSRLSPSQRVQQQWYRGPSRPGMIAPRAQQARDVPNARELGRRSRAAQGSNGDGDN